MKEIIGIIPAAGEPKGIWFSNDQEKNDSMVPISGKPAIFWTLNSFVALGIKKVCIIVKRRGSALEEFATMLFGHQIQLKFVELPSSLGVGHSVIIGAKNFKNGSPCLVVLGDTVLWDIGVIQLSAESFATTCIVNDPRRWCVAETKSTNITRLLDKPTKIDFPAKALTGIYFFANGITTDSKSIREKHSTSQTIEMSDILKPLVEAKELKWINDPKWLDVGNPDHVFDAHSTLIQSRTFNQLKIDTDRGTITKKSTYGEKFYDEINYFKLLPKDLEVFFPRVVHSSTEPNSLSIETEYYAYPTLADLFLFQSLQREIWVKIFIQLRQICDTFAKRNYGVAYECGHEVFVEKNKKRLAEFVRKAPQDLINLLNSPNLRINGKPVIPLEKAFEVSKDTLVSVAKTTEMSPIHGDLCFSNVLCEPNRGLMKLIDPRGSFGNKGILGDPRYDLAKIHHSVIGLYDFIVNDLYDLKVQRAKASYTFPKKSITSIIQSQYSEVFLNRQNYKSIQMITAWLFLSMLPLHSDSKRRQTALGLRGLELLTEALQ